MWTSSHLGGVNSTPLTPLGYGPALASVFFSLTVPTFSLPLFFLYGQCQWQQVHDQSSLKLGLFDFVSAGLLLALCAGVSRLSRLSSRIHFLQILLACQLVVVLCLQLFGVSWVNCVTKIKFSLSMDPYRLHHMVSSPCPW